MYLLTSHLSVLSVYASIDCLISVQLCVYIMYVPHRYIYTSILSSPVYHTSISLQESNMNSEFENSRVVMIVRVNVPDLCRPEVLFRIRQSRVRQSGIEKVHASPVEKVDEAYSSCVEKLKQ